MEDVDMELIRQPYNMLKKMDWVSNNSKVCVLTVTHKVTESCFPFQSENGEYPPCPQYCYDGTGPLLSHTLKVNNSRTFETNDIKGMQLSVMNGGSLVASMDIYRDFLNYKGGVYKHLTGYY